MLTSLLLVLLPFSCNNKYDDNDGDGFFGSDDCNDSDPNVHINAAEVCNGVDDDCDGQIDDQDSDIDLDSLLTFYTDNDGDGHGGAQTIQLCAIQDGYLEVSTDCDDSNPDINPDAPELCNGIDDNCNALIDDDDSELDSAQFAEAYIDVDGDGFGGTLAANCTELDQASVQSGDCNDLDSTVYPDAPEICDDIDSDCDGLDDPEDPDIPDTALYVMYLDNDQDSFGDPNTVEIGCSPLPGYTNNNQDCDDNNAGVNPNAIEVCDGLDNDCDPSTDEAGMVSRWSSSSYFDETINAADGTPSAPFILELTEPNTIHFCEGNYDVQFYTNNSLNLIGFGNAVLSGGGAHHIVLADNLADNSTFVLEDLSIIDSTQLQGAILIDGDNAQNVTLTVDSCKFENNYAYAGGGLLINETTINIFDSQFIGNGSVQGGAIYTSNSTLTINTSEFEANQADEGAAIDADTSIITLDQVTMANNQSTDGSINFDSSHLTCIGDPNGFYGLQNNVGAVGGIKMSASSELVSNGCDFGTYAAGTDNEGFDVAIGSNEYYAGDDSSFNCVNGSCGTSNAVTLSNATQWANPMTCPVNPEMIGTILTIQGNPTIDSFSLEATDYFLCQNAEITAVIFKEDNGIWTEVWSSSFDLPPNLFGYVTSGPVGKAFEDGDQIALAFYGYVRLTYGYTQQNPTTYPNLGIWNGDHVLGQYDGSNFPSLIKSTVGSPSMTVSHTNLP